MANKPKTNQDRGMVKDPEDWVTGDEPMTGAQDSYVHTLAREAGEAIPEAMSKAKASEKIEELQKTTGRGTSASKSRPKTRPKTNSRSKV